MTLENRRVCIKKERDTFTLPTKGSEHAAGYDLYAAITDTLYIKPFAGALIPCGFSLEMPIDIECQIRPRSGLATKKHLIIPNSPGTIDADFRGEVHVYLLNIGDETQVIEPNMRIAQMVFNEVIPFLTIEESNELSITERGTGGFGSTGL